MSGLGLGFLRNAAGRSTCDFMDVRGFPSGRSRVEICWETPIHEDCTGALARC